MILVALALPRLSDRLVQGPRVQVVFGELLSLEGGKHIVVASDERRRLLPRQHHALNRSLGAQAHIERVGICIERRADEISTHRFAHAVLKRS